MQALKQLCAVDLLSRSMEDEAVAPVARSVVEGLVAALRAHAHDPGIAGITINALGKLAAHPDNHAAMVDFGVVQAALAAGTEHGHLASDARFAEGFAGASRGGRACGGASEASPRSERVVGRAKRAPEASVASVSEVASGN